MKLTKRTVLIASAAAAALPFAAFAAIDSPDKLIGVVNTLAGWLYSGLIALAVVFIIIASYNFLFSGGEEKKVETAKNQLLYAVIAVATAILATGIIKVVQQLLGASS